MLRIQIVSALLISSITVNDLIMVCFLMICVALIAYDVTINSFVNEWYLFTSMICVISLSDIDVFVCSLLSFSYTCVCCNSAVVDSFG